MLLADKWRLGVSLTFSEPVDKNDAIKAVERLVGSGNVIAVETEGASAVAPAEPTVQTQG